MNHSDGCERETRESGCDAILSLFDSDYFYSVTFLDVDCRGVLPPFASPPIPVFLDLSWVEFISSVLDCGFPYRVVPFNLLHSYSAAAQEVSGTDRRLK